MAQQIALMDVEVEVDEAIVSEYDVSTRSVDRHWRLLGMLLKVKETCLNEIQQDYPASEWKKQMLRIWLKHDPVDPDRKLKDALAKIQNKCPNLESKRV